MSEDHDGKLIVSGNTFPYKKDLKYLGFKWNGTYKSWENPINSVRVRDQVRQTIGSALTDAYDEEVDAPPLTRISYKSEHKPIGQRQQPEQKRSRPVLAPIERPERNEGGVKVHLVDDEPQRQTPVAHQRRADPVSRHPVAHQRRAVEATTGHQRLPSGYQRQAPMRQMQSEQGYPMMRQYEPEQQYAQHHFEELSDHRTCIELEVYYPSDEEY